ncbi:VOC family protein [Sphingomonas cavernae]|uniref:Glyoxalase n=1 Tax=Sphingomonas cavernae TaxID=2320861 RepID=A0A418WR87_9SPHN|nr:VOC family protein [Sphingomonas cavernae]RJF93768.1 glyoxalase [Sphingomonas cavernae]
MPVRPALIPCLSYKDAPAAIAFLCDAFGFGRHAVYADDKDPDFIHHAQLVRDGQMVMLSSFARDSDYMKKANILHPQDAGGNTQSIYVVIDDVDGHATTARAAGARIILDPADQDYDGRVYSAFDTEGYAWSFGNYDPWAE